MEIIATNNLNISYGNIDIVSGLNIEILEGKITAIIGPNGCGKSTILKTLARILSQSSGSIYLNGKDIHAKTSIEIAKEMAILPQMPKSPKGLAVEELVEYGRYPHQSLFGKLNKDDKEKVQWALNVTGVNKFREKIIDELSGGQRQKVWIAMALAQDTPIILLDEPTTYLDLAHQLEVLKLLEKLNKEQKRSIVIVIHEINMASRFANYIIAIKDGTIIKEGTPEVVITKEVLKQVFSIDAHIEKAPLVNKPVCVYYENI